MLRKNHLKLLRLTTATANNGSTGKPTKIDVFCEQVIDSLIMGGLGGISAYIAAGENVAFKVFALAFGLAFLVKLKEYRRIQ